MGARGLVLGRLRGSGAPRFRRRCGCGGRLPLLPSIAARTVVDRHRRARRLARPRGGAAAGRRGGRERAVATAAQLPVWQRRLLVASGAGAGFAASTTCRWAARCSRSRCCSARSRCRSCCRRWPRSDRDRGRLDHARYAPHLHLPDLCRACLRRSSGRCWSGRSSGLIAVGWVAPDPARDALRPALGAVRGADRGVRRARRGRRCLSAAARQRQGRRAARGARRLAFGLLAVLLVLKPLATAACLGTGAPGGLFTPTLTIGVLLAGVLGDDLGPHLARGAARQLRGDRRRRVPGGGDAGPRCRGWC